MHKIWSVADIWIKGSPILKDSPYLYLPSQGSSSLYCLLHKYHAPIKTLRSHSGFLLREEDQMSGWKHGIEQRTVAQYEPYSWLHAVPNLMQDNITSQICRGAQTLE